MNVFCTVFCFSMRTGYCSKVVAMSTTQDYYSEKKYTLQGVVYQLVTVVADSSYQATGERFLTLASRFRPANLAV